MCKRGDIYIVDLPESKGSVQKGDGKIILKLLETYCNEYGRSYKDFMQMV